MKKILSVLIAVAMVCSFVVGFGISTASAATVTKTAANLPYGWVDFTANGPTAPGTFPVIHGSTAATFIYYTMGDIIQGQGGNPGGQVALVGYGPDSAFNTADDVIVSVAPVASDIYGSFAIATSSVPQDGAYAIRDYTGNVLGALLVSNIYIRYRFSIDQTSLTYNCSAQVVSGWVFRGDGTGAAYSASIVPAGQAGAYTTYVHVIYPDGTDVYTTVLANGQFALAVNVNQKGVYRIYVEDNYGDPANPGNGGTEFGFVYAQLPTGSLSITLSTYVDPTYLYAETSYQQEVVLKAVDQDGDAVTGANFSMLNGFSSWNAYEISPGIYKVVGIKSGSAGIASFQLSSTIGGSTLLSNVVNIPFKALSKFNPVVSVDVYNGPNWEGQAVHDYTASESTYDKLPCTVGYSLVIKPGVFNPVSGYELIDVSATVSGPVYNMEDTVPTIPLAWSSNVAPLPAGANVITQVGDPGFYTWNTPGRQLGTGTGSASGIVYDGTYSGKDWFYNAPRYLVTGPGTISVQIDQTNWKQVDPNQEIGPYNACCDPETATFKICDVPGCDVTPSPTYMTVGTPTDLSVNVTSGAGLSCGCNVIVHIIPSFSSHSDFFTLPNGQKVPDLWFNISGAGQVLPFGVVAPGSTYYGATYTGGTVTFPGVTANYCDYLKVEVFTQVLPSGCSPTPVWVYAFVDPVAIYAGVSSTTLSYSIVGITGSDNNYLVAGVPDTVIISGFSTHGALSYVRMDVSGAGDYYNTDVAYAATNNGDGTYTISFTPPPSVWGTAYPNKIKISLYDSTTTPCTTSGSVVIPVKMPTFDTTITTACGDSFANDNIITEGFAEKLTLSNLVDPRTGNALVPTDFFVKTSSSCYIPTAWKDSVPCEGCNSTTISIIALDNPNIDATPVVRPYITLNGVSVRLYGAELTVKPPTISVSPNTDIPFTSAGLPVTMLTFSAIDAHGNPMCGKTFAIYDTNTMTDSYQLIGFTSQTLTSLCDVELGGIPYKPSFSSGIDDHIAMYILRSGSSYMYHTGTTGSNGKVIYPFAPGTGGMYAATITPDVAQEGAPVAPLKAFMSLMKLTFQTTYVPPVVDTEAPVVTVTTPADGSKVTADTVKVAGTATDNVGVVSLWVGSQKIDFAPDGSFSTMVTLDKGANTIKVVAYDAAGNKGEKDVTVTYAPAKVTVVKVTIGSDIMTVNGAAVQLDAAPEIVNGRTFLPLRAISEALGATVDWIPDTQGITVTLGGNTVGLQIGNTSAVVNGTVMTLDAAPYIKNSRTMVPFRVIAEGLGAVVGWDAPSKTVTVTLTQSQ